MTSAAAESRVLRTIALLFGVAGAVFGLLTLPTITDQVSAAPLPWTVAALLATLGIPVLVGLLAPAAPTGVLRLVGACVAIGNLAAMATVPLFFAVGASAAESPWVLQLTALGTTGAALALPVELVAVDVLLTGMLVINDRLVTGNSALGLIAVQDGLYATLFCAVFAGLAIGALRAGRAVDAAAAAASATVTAARDERIRSDERVRIDGLVHDHVLTTLLVAARSSEPSPGAAAAATEALDQLRVLTGPLEAGRPLPVDDLRDRLRAQLTALLPAARFTTDGQSAGGAVPSGVVEAAIGATGEALRNVRRHAGPDATTELHLTLDDGAFEIAVVDDGPGFEPDAVPLQRLGIATSIVARLRQVGGEAEVRSHPGRGTAVRMRWPAA